MTIKKHDTPEAPPVQEDPDEVFSPTAPPAVVYARWPGECAGCGEPYEDEAQIFNTGSGWNAVECCGDEVGL